MSDTTTETGRTRSAVQAALVRTTPVQPPQSVWTEVPSLGVSLHARSWRGSGAGPTVVLLHGLALSSRYLVPLGGRLAALGYDVMAPDLPGFGRSPKLADASWPAGPSVRDQTDQLRAWLDAAGIDRAVFFGNSIGVQVAVELAAHSPDRVAGLVLAGPTPDPRYRTALRQYLRVLANQAFEVPSLQPVFQLEYASAGVARLVQQLRRSVDDPVEDRLPRVQAPTLVIRGRHDQTLTQDWAEQFTSLLPDAALVVVEGTAHNLHYSAPHVTARLMARFLSDGLDGIRAADVVVPGPEHGDDPLAPRQPISTRVHGVLDYATAGLLLTAPRALGWGSRTRRLLATAGIGATAYSLLTEYELGAVRKLPMPVHLNLDAASGLRLLLAAATRLRGEPAAGRWGTAVMGAFEVLAATVTRPPVGPVRLVRTSARA